MSRRAALFTEADIYRAIKAVERAGAHMMVKISTKGEICIVPIRSQDEPQEPVAELSGAVL